LISKRTFRSLSAAALLAVGIGIMSCGGQANTSSGSTNSAASPAASSSPVQTKGHAEAIHLVLTGGAGAGPFDLDSSMPCTYLSSNKLWSAEGGDPSSTTIIAFTLAVDTSKSPATFTFGALTQSLSGQSYDISTLANIGSGSADVLDLGATARITMNGQTKEGYRVTATVQCNQINRV
jgi:hypothetical protein